MNARMLMLMIAVVAPAPTFAATTDGGASGKTYMWVDKNGVRQYGDAVPPEYTQGERRVLNKDGVQTSTEGSRKNAEQLAEEQRQLDAKHAREQHDRFLLNTYTSTRDIDRLRDERLQQLDGQIRATEAYVESLVTRLQTTTERALLFKPYSDRVNARRMPDDVAEQLVRSSNEVIAQQKSIATKRQEVQQVRSKFDDDRARYQELTAKNKTG
jgi:5-methylcytosine-specific restriction endonuclease McrBC regulatory subunit McrC